MLFIRSIMMLDDQTLSRKIVYERAKRCFQNPTTHNFDPDHSIVLDLLRVASLLNLYEDIKNMVERDHSNCKNIWKEKVWTRAWDLENVYWRVESNLHRGLDLLRLTCPERRCLTWWFISDISPKLTFMCETLAKLLCHASLLKVDDVRLKGIILASRFCTIYVIWDRYRMSNILLCSAQPPLQHMNTLLILLLILLRLFALS